MQKSFIVLAMLLIGGSACTDVDQTAPRLLTGEDEAQAASATATARDRFSAHLSGREEVPPANTRAQGQAVFQLSDDGQALHFRINVANITNVNQSHIHLGAFGVNGPVVAWLRPEGPPPELIPGRINGPYAEGILTAEDLVGPLLGAPLSALIDAMAAGNTYVNVHTLQFPGGEIRGQIRQHGNPNR